MRRSRARRGGGLERGIQRHRITSRIVEHADDDLDDEELSPLHWWKRQKILKQLGKWAKICFDLSTSVSSQLCLVTLVKDGKGRMKPASFFRRVVWRIIYTLVLLSMVYKLGVCIGRFKSESAMNLTTFVSLFGLWCQVVGMSVGMGLILQPTATMELINSWLGLLKCLKEFRGGRPLSPLSSFSVTIQIILTTIGTTNSILAVAAFSLYFTSAPIFVLPALEQAGIFSPGDLLPKWLWRLIFYPAELFQFGAPLVPYATWAHIFMMESGLFKIFTNELRKGSTKTLEERMKVESMYVVLRVHNQIYKEWVRRFIPLVLFSLGAAVVDCLFLALSNSELPGLVILVFVGMAIFIMVVLFWIFLDQVKLIRASEEVIGALQSVPDPGSEISMVQQQRFLKRARALRPIGLPIGSFGEFCLDVPVIMWEEILNQLIFLLSF